MSLYTILDPFILHSFLDKLIGNNIGNNANDTLVKFIRYIPEPYKNRFVRSSRFAKEILDRMDNLNHRVVPDKIPHQSNDLYKAIIKKYSPEYGSSEHRIDIDRDTDIDNSLNHMINQIIKTSKTDPCFITSGYQTNKTGHCIGLIITSNYVIICNSGEGLEHHIWSRSSDVNEKMSGGGKKIGTKPQVDRMDDHKMDARKIDDRKIDDRKIDAQKPDAHKKIGTKPQVDRMDDRKIDARKIDDRKIDARKIGTKPDALKKIGTKPDALKKIGTKPDALKKIGTAQVDMMDDRKIDARETDALKKIGPAQVDIDEIEAEQEVPTVRTNGRDVLDSAGKNGVEDNNILNKEYPQTIIFIDRPDDKFLFDFIKKMLILRNKYLENNIKKFYTEIYKLYILQLIKQTNSVGRVCEITKNVFDDIIRDKIINMEDSESLNLKNAWIHPNNFTGTMYRAKKIISRENIPYDEIANMYNDKIFETNKNKLYSFDQFIRNGIQMMVSKCDDRKISIHRMFKAKYLFMLMLLAPHEYTNKSYSYKTKVLFTELLTESDIIEINDRFKRYNQNEDDSDEDDSIDINIHQMIDRIFYSNYNNGSDEGKNTPVEDPLVRAAGMILSDDIMGTFGAGQNVIRHMRIQYGSIYGRYDTMICELVNAREYDSKHQDTSNYTMLSLFINLLMSESRIDKNGDIYFKNISVDEKNLASKQKLFDLMDRDQQLSDVRLAISRAIDQHNLVSQKPDNFFTIEQFSGSCTYNGMFLAISLYGDNILYQNKESSLTEYYEDYYKLHYGVRFGLFQFIENFQITKNSEYSVLKQITEMYVHEIKQIENLLNGLSEGKLKQILKQEKVRLVEQYTTIRLKLNHTILQTYNQIKFEMIKSAPLPEEKDDAHLIIGDDAPFIDRLVVMIDRMKKMWKIIWDEKQANEKQATKKISFNSNVFIRNVMGPTIRLMMDNQQQIVDDLEIIRTRIYPLITSFMKNIALVMYDRTSSDKYKFINNDMTEIYQLCLYIVLKIISVTFQTTDDNLQMIKKKASKYKNLTILDNILLVSDFGNDEMTEFITIIGNYDFLITRIYLFPDSFNYNRNVNHYLYSHVAYFLKKSIPALNNYTNEKLINYYYRTMQDGIMLTEFIKCGAFSLYPKNNNDVPDKKINKVHYPNKNTMDDKWIGEQNFLDINFSIYRDSTKITIYRKSEDRDKTGIIIIFKKKSIDYGSDIVVSYNDNDDVEVFYVDDIIVHPMNMGVYSAVQISINFECDDIKYCFISSSVASQYRTHNASAEEQLTIPGVHKLYELNIYNHPLIDFEEIHNIMIKQSAEANDMNIQSNYVQHIMSESTYAAHNSAFNRHSVMKTNKLGIKLVQNKSADEIGIYSMINQLSTNDNQFSPDYIVQNEYNNVSKLMEYYKRKYDELIKSIKVDNSPKKLKLIYDLGILVGDRMTYNLDSEKKSDDVDHIEIHLSDEYKIMIKMISSGFRLTDDAYLHIDRSNIRLNDFMLLRSYDELKSMIDNSQDDDIVRAYEKKKSNQLIKNMMYYSQNMPNFIVGINKSRSQALIAFVPKTITYYQGTLYDNQWTDINKENDTTIHEPLLAASNSSASLLWVTFDTDNFNIAIPKPDNRYIDSTRYGALTFSLFCEYLLLSGKYDLFNLMIPQLVSYYLTEFNENKKPVEIHQYLIKFIIGEHKYVPCPFRFYILNKINYLLKGYLDRDDVMSYVLRTEYYENRYKELNFVPIITDRQFDLSYYNKWLQSINEVLIDDNLTKQTIIGIIDGILGDMNKPEEYTLMTTDIYDIQQIVESNTNIIDYLCDEKVNAEYVFSLQYKIMITIKKKINQIDDDDTKSIIGNIKYFLENTFPHTDEYENIKYIKLFEIITGKIVNATQFTTIRGMIEDERNIDPSIYELLMGGGKTAVIIPCIIFIYMMNKKYKNVINCLPPHLIAQSMDILGQLCPFFTNGLLVRVHIDRTDDKYMDNILELQTIKTIVMTQTSIQAYILNKNKNTKDSEHWTRQPIDCDELDVKQPLLRGGVYIPLHDRANSNVVDMMKRQIYRNSYSDYLITSDRRKLLNSNFQLYTDTLLIMDEFDMLIDPLKSDLNYPNNDKQNINQSDVLFRLIYGVTEYLFDNHKQYMTNTDRSNETINKQIVNDALRAIIETREMMEYFTHDKIKNILDELSKSNGQIGGTAESVRMFFYREVNKYYTACLKYMLDKDYGLDDNVYVAIPYLAQKTPATGSRYSNPVITCILTCIAYFSNSLRLCDVDQIRSYVIQLIELSDIGEVIAITNISENIIHAFAMSDNMKAYNIMTVAFDTNPENYRNYLKFFLFEIVFKKYMMTEPNILNCSMIDVIDPNFMLNKMAISGTVNIHVPEFAYNKSNIKRIGDAKTKIDGALSGKAADPPNILLYEDTDTMSASDKLITFIKIVSSYDVLIDVGSFMRNYTNELFAKTFSQQDTNKEKYVIYFDNLDKPVVLLDGIRIPDFNLGRIKHEKNIFVYFDQKHTIGTDIDIRSTARGILTINDMTVWREVVQGLYRLREINYHQKCDYITKTSQTLEQIIQLIQTNESIQHNNSITKYYQQVLLCLLRNYAKYEKDSYKYRSFIPNILMSEKIFDISTYNHDYEKEAFLSFMQTNLCHYDKMYADERAKNTPEYTNMDIYLSKIRQQIIQYIDYYRLNNSSDKKTLLFTTQMESEIAQQINIVIESSVSNERLATVPKYTISCKMKFNNLFDPFSYPISINIVGSDVDGKSIYENTLYSNKKINAYPLNFLLDNGVMFTASALQEVINFLRHKGTYKNLYIRFPTDQKGVHDTNKCCIVSSADIMVHTLYVNIDELPLYEKIGNMIIRDKSYRATINNILFILLCRIPHRENIGFLKTCDSFNWKAIKEHYTKYFEYDVDKTFPYYAELLNSHTLSSVGGGNSKYYAIYTVNKQLYTNLINHQPFRSI